MIWKIIRSILGGSVYLSALILALVITFVVSFALTLIEIHIPTLIFYLLLTFAGSFTISFVTLALLRSQREKKVLYDRLLELQLRSEQSFGEELERLRAGVTTIPDPPQRLVSACASGDCVLVLGGGIAAQAGFPTWREALSDIINMAKKIEGPEFLKILEKDLITMDAENLSEAADIIGLRIPREQLLSFIKRIYDIDVSKLPVICRVLQDIPFSAVLTTNYDNLLEATFRRPNMAVLTPQDAEKFGSLFREKRFMLLKMYGDLSKPESFIFGQQEFRRTIYGNQEFAKFLTYLFYSKTMFFVGASLNGIEDFLSSLQLKDRPSESHFALVPWRKDAEIRAEYFLRTYGVQLLWYTPTRGFPEVTRFVKNLGDLVAVATAPFTPAKKKVRTAELVEIMLGNIGPFKELKLEFNTKWTILLGDNGFGKSTILKAIALGLCGDDERVTQAVPTLLRAGEKSGFVELRISGDSYRTELVREGAKVKVHSRQITPIQAGQWVALGFPPLRGISTRNPRGPTSEGSPNPVVEDVLPLLTSTIDQRIDDEKQWIVNMQLRAEGGSGLLPAQVHRYKRLSRSFFHLLEGIGPGARFKFSHIDRNSWQIMVETEDGIVPIDVISQGMLSIFNWVGTLLLRMYEIYGESKKPENESALVLVDEIDAHLHPQWQRILVPTLKERFANLQLIATTHSPLVVGNLDAGEVVLLRREEESKRIVPTRLESFHGWRADQILTGPAFEMDSSRDNQTVSLMAEYATLLGKTRRSEKEKQRFEELRAILGDRVPTPYETPKTREAYDLFEKWLLERFNNLPEERKREILTEVNEYLHMIQ